MDYHHGTPFDDPDVDSEDWKPREPRCRTCGSTDVRWRQQGGKWVLFSLQPGVDHRCPSEALADDFDEVKA